MRGHLWLILFSVEFFFFLIIFLISAVLAEHVWLYC